MVRFCLREQYLSSWLTTNVYNYIIIKLNLIYCNHVAASVLLLFTLAAFLLHTATHAVYTVTPDDHYYPNTTCHHCHNLQHYLLNVTKYFTSNTQLLFLPGLHHLHTDLIIQNVHKISLIGSTANDTTLDMAIIKCNSSIGITMSKISDLTMANLVIDSCKIKKNVLNIDRQIFWANGMILSHCYNVQLQNITVYRSDQYYRSALLVINLLGISSFINITSNGLKIEYNEVNGDGKEVVYIFRTGPNGPDQTEGIKFGPPDRTRYLYSKLMRIV